MHRDLIYDELNIDFVQIEWQLMTYIGALSYNVLGDTGNGGWISNITSTPLIAHTTYPWHGGNM